MIDPIEDPSSDSRNEIDKNTFSGYGSNTLSSKTSNSSVWKALNQRIIPRTEQLLMKSLTDKSGSRIQQLRSPVALALTKLFQKLPLEVLLDKVPRLVLEVCTALRSRDSDCRDIARETLARMAASLGENYLSLMLNHLATTLTEGYQLHVRSAALHSILLSLSKVYTVPSTLADKDFRSLPFDQCVPAVMDLIMQDLFGVASEMKEVEYVEKRLVKEA
jgi:U3 small nucleolar RNA-associated protein 20